METFYVIRETKGTFSIEHIAPIEVIQSVIQRRQRMLKTYVRLQNGK